MHGQTWLGAATAFLGMWVLMMVPMMLPSLVPMLGRYRRAVDAGPGVVRLGGLTVLVGAGYFFMWALLGIGAFPLGVATEALARHVPVAASAIPIAAGVIVLVAGSFQLTAWKMRQLIRCQEHPPTQGADALTAWRHGMRLGLHCARCCANLMAILMAIGIMDVGAMVAVTAAITVERLAPGGERFARAIGAVAVTAGLFLIARAARS